jgi:hypothetical protein
MGIGGDRYALFAVGLGKVDTRAYKNLVFSARGKRGGETAMIYLNDGRKKATVSLEAYGPITTEWRRVEVPLTDFGKKINRAALNELSFAWEEQSIPDQTLYLDEIRFE